MTNIKYKRTFVFRKEVLEMKKGHKYGMKKETKTVIDLYLSGMAMNQICEETKKSRSAIYQILKLHNVVRTRPRCADEEIIKLIKEGRTAKEISGMLKCSSARIGNIRKKYNMSKPNIHGPKEPDISTEGLTIKEDHRRMYKVVEGGKKYVDVTEFYNEMGGFGW